MKVLLGVAIGGALWFVLSAPFVLLPVFLIVGAVGFLIVETLGEGRAR